VSVRLKSGRNVNGIAYDEFFEKLMQEIRERSLESLIVATDASEGKTNPNQEASN
jgi:hypothetical protein